MNRFLGARLAGASTRRGSDLLRVKGIVNVEGRPVVVQGVGHVFHPPVTLDRWPMKTRAAASSSSRATLNKARWTRP
jgi:G3E family GTPase